MYFLNDIHYKYEYGIYIRVGSATPFIKKMWFTNFDDVLNYVKEIEKKHNRYNQIFYIDNEFYKNQYQQGIGTYYKFLRRPVNDWEEFSSETISNNDFIDSKIVNIFDYFEKTKKTY